MTVISFDTETYLITDTDKAPKPVVCSWRNATTGWLTRPGDPWTFALWADPSNHFVGQNIPYDIVLMMRWHPELTPHIMRALDDGRVWDVGMREKLVHLATEGIRGFNPRVSLADLCQKYLGIDVSATKKGDDIWRLKYGTLDGVPFVEWPAEATQYALDDAQHTYDIFMKQGGIENAQPTEPSQVRAAVVLNAIGVYGFAIDQEIRGKMKTALEAQYAELAKQVEPLGWSGSGSKKKLQAVVRGAWNRVLLNEIYKHATAQGITFDYRIFEEKALEFYKIDALNTLKIKYPSLDTTPYLDKANIADFLEESKYIPGLSERTPVKEILKEIPANPDYYKYIDHLKTHIQPIPGCVFPPGLSPVNFTSDTAKIEKRPVCNKTGLVADEEVLTDLKDYIPEAKVYLEFKHIQKMLSTYIEPYQWDTIHPRFVPVVSTSRTGCGDPNVQNVPRKDKTKPNEAFRTMFRARPGRKLGTVDYSQLELCTLSATIRHMFPDVFCVLGDYIDKNVDVHCVTGGAMINASYEQMMANKKVDGSPEAEARQKAKAVNFGRPGGLGAVALMSYAKNNYGVEITYEEARKFLNQQRDMYPCVTRYLKSVGDIIENSPDGKATGDCINGQTKARLSYTELANYRFQCLAAYGAKEALWAVWRECVLGYFWNHTHLAQGYGSELKHTPLRESALVNFVHDEIVAEHPDGQLGEAALKRQEELMVAAMTLACKNLITIRVEGKLSDQWEH